MSSDQNLTQEDYESYMAFYNDTVAFENTIGLLIPSIFAVIILIGVIGNLLVVVVALNRQMRNSTNTLIIGLAISDLMFLLICIPFTAVDYATPVYMFPSWTCSLINYCQHCTAYFSVWTLTFMAADRFLAVCFPVGSMTLRNTRNTFFLLVICYTVIAISQIPIAFMHDIYYYDFLFETRSACAIVSIAQANATVLEARVYFISFNVFGYILPLGITSIFYYCMLKRLWHTPRPGNNNSVSSSVRHRPETVRAKRKVTRLVLCVVVIWAFCWLPLNVCFFFSGLTYPDSLVVRGGKIMVIMQISSQVLAYTNSCLNPILYALMSDNFRKGFLRILGVITNRATWGLFCTSEARSAVSRMEITNYGHNSASSNARPKSIKRLHHASSAPTCTTAAGVTSFSANGAISAIVEKEPTELKVTEHCSLLPEEPRRLYDGSSLLPHQTSRKEIEMKVEVCRNRNTLSPSQANTIMGAGVVKYRRISKSFTSSGSDQCKQYTKTDETTAE